MGEGMGDTDNGIGEGDKGMAELLGCPTRDDTRIHLNRSSPTSSMGKMVSMR